MNASQPEPGRSRDAIIFLAWGSRYLGEVRRCLAADRHIAAYDKFLVTEAGTAPDIPGLNIIDAEFAASGLLRKTELLDHIPPGYRSYLFLDSDTVVLDDISLGFERAARHGIAVAPAPHYSLDRFWKFGRIMRRQGEPELGQLQYNTGVIFFRVDTRTRKIFQRWRQLATEYQAELANDQPYFTLAMEQLGFNPYSLSISFNYRAYGEPISGPVRIWHSHSPPPGDINRYRQVWPGRRAIPGKVLPPLQRKPRAPQEE